MEKVTLAHNLQLSKIVHGHWRLNEWKLSPKELLQQTQKLIDHGITSIDHADIYGDYSCEALFGEALKLQPAIRKDLQIITKCGIKLVSDKYPKRKIKHYDYSYKHIINSVENSLKNFGTDYIDLLLLHRPAPFFCPEEVARAFKELRKSGKVLQFGVSNFNPTQYQALNSFWDEKLVTNQVEINPLCLEHFDNGNMDFFQQEKIHPMAWSPLAGGRLFNWTNDIEHRVYHNLHEVAKELSLKDTDIIAYAWLLMHPAGIIPIVGSGKWERIEKAIKAFDINLSLEQWYAIYVAALGSDVA